jgi:hypothetical protein
MPRDGQISSQNRQFFRNRHRPPWEVLPKHPSSQSRMPNATLSPTWSESEVMELLNACLYDSPPEFDMSQYWNLTCVAQSSSRR